jgi:hypothetical protein
LPIILICVDDTLDGEQARSRHRRQRALRDPSSSHRCGALTPSRVPARSRSRQVLQRGRHVDRDVLHCLLPDHVYKAVLHDSHTLGACERSFSTSDGRARPSQCVAGRAAGAHTLRAPRQDPKHGHPNRLILFLLLSAVRTHSASRPSLVSPSSGLWLDARPT